MKINRQFLVFGLITSLATTAFTGCGQPKKALSEDGTIHITNVSYDPTREFYTEYNKEFSKYWEAKTGHPVEVTQSHGGSGSQARSVIEGNEADVVTLALANDISAIERNELIDENWMSEFEYNSSPYTSTIVFLVRKGNPKNISDWDDIVKKDVEIITPNPKTSGGACWNFLAAWAFAQNKYNNDEKECKKFIKKLYSNVTVLDSGARRSTNTFVENKQGDVLLAWENEALLTLKQQPDEYEIVSPSISILAEPSVAVVDYIAKIRESEEVSAGYLEYLYSDVAQNLAAKNFYRPTNETILQNYSDTFDLNMSLVTIDDFGGWDKAFEKFFDDGTIFDEIYAQ